MKVLMFGWEFPPHISGGLGTACYGLTRALKKENTEILFVVPRAYGDEEIRLIDASNIWIDSKSDQKTVEVSKAKATAEVVVIPVSSGLLPYVNPSEDLSAIQQWNWEHRREIHSTNELVDQKRFKFSGSYGINLINEVMHYGEVAGTIARENVFDVIHAHDWLAYPAGIAAKRVSGKPLIIHVHATEYDRAGEENSDPRVRNIELSAMKDADRIITVSELTKKIVVEKYNIDARKIHVVHNGVMPGDRKDFPFLPKISNHVVTFLGRITFQKGPQYFIEAAQRVLERFPDTHFIMAGSGDLLPSMIERVAQLGLASRIHFTGFVRGVEVRQVWSVSDVYVMPSVSEPFGITPLEAIQSGVPVIISCQSGVSEVLKHAIKVDFWNTEALANAIVEVLERQEFSESLRIKSKKEVESLTWKRAAKKINRLYDELVGM